VKFNIHLYFQPVFVRLFFRPVTDREGPKINNPLTQEEKLNTNKIVEAIKAYTSSQDFFKDGGHDVTTTPGIMIKPSTVMWLKTEEPPTKQDVIPSDSDETNRRHYYPYKINEEDGRIKDSMVTPNSGMNNVPTEDVGDIETADPTKIFDNLEDQAIENSITSATSKTPGNC